MQFLWYISLLGSCYTVYQGTFFWWQGMPIWLNWLIEILMQLLFMISWPIPLDYIGTLPPSRYILITLLFRPLPEFSHTARTTLLFLPLPLCNVIIWIWGVLRRYHLSAYAFLIPCLAVWVGISGCVWLLNYLPVPLYGGFT